ncbi:MAG: DNA translocase FtsK [Patescibacteria group bacterium]|nr:MAG: DNA translocase FtsK [Patescibacteria group bacterium]
MRIRRRSSYRRKSFKLKLKKNTVYNLFAVGLFLASGLLFLSFTRNGTSAILINNILQEKFGRIAIFVPFVPFFFAFFLLHLKIFLSRAHVAFGYLVFFVSLLGLTKSGTIGNEMFDILEEILTTIGADLVLLSGIIVGNIVFFDTSVDEVFEFLGKIKNNLHRLVPLSLFNKTRVNTKFQIDRNKPLIINGGQKDEIIQISHNTGPAVINTREKETTDDIFSTNMVTNIPSGTGNGIWEYPPISLLEDSSNTTADRGDVKKIAGKIEDTLQNFGVKARVVEVNPGPAVTQYALELASGTKISKITSLANDLALATEAPTGQIRIEAPIPGRNLVGIEIPNRSLEVVTLRTMLASPIMQKSKSKLAVSLGLDVSGKPVIADIGKMPHVLVAGTTGSGKSVLVNSFICSLLFRASPQEVKLILIDPKRVEFTAYNGIPHLLVPVIVDVDKILSALKWAVEEMKRRYKLFEERGVRNLEGYNELSGFQALPYIVIIIDELADLMMYAPVEVEDNIARLAQMARATGIHLVIATQRPSVNVITGLIKANIPCRIAFNVSSMIDSRVIIDAPGAEKLLGRGDMLYVPPDQAKPTRIQGAFVSEKEVKRLVDFLKSNNYPVEYTEEIINQPLRIKGKPGLGSEDGRDPLFEEAVRLICQFNTASASFLQRKLQIGFARAARLTDQLEEAGIIGPSTGSKAREIFIGKAQEYLANLQQQ